MNFLIVISIKKRKMRHILKTVAEFAKFKNDNKKITMITCYDYWSAKIIDESEIDAVLVGDSVAMVMHGFETTVNADVEMMAFHTAAVKRGLHNKFLVTDLPFLAHKKGIEFLVKSVDRIFKSGAQAIKIEGAGDNLKDIEFLVKSGIPVMGHLGLTPQSVHQLSGFKLQGKSDNKAEQILEDAKKLEQAGCFSIVLEMIPQKLAKEITDEIDIPTIGIGAGKFTSGQILVLQDLLGMSNTFSPKFLRKYLNGYDVLQSAINKYSNDVRDNIFPSNDESY